MASVVELCNLALSEVRGGSINSLDESSLAAQLCRLHYPVVRDLLLREAPWQFANRIAPLALLSDNSFGVEQNPNDPFAVFNWAYTYRYPGDALKVNRLIINFESIRADDASPYTRYYLRNDFLENRFPNVRNQVKYEILHQNGDKVIVANETELRADYIARVEDPNEFDSIFYATLPYLLAARLAIPLVGNDSGRSYKADALQQYEVLLASAIAANSNEQYEYVTDSDLVNVRY